MTRPLDGSYFLPLVYPAHDAVEQGPEGAGQQQYAAVEEGGVAVAEAGGKTEGDNGGDADEDGGFVGVHGSTSLNINAKRSIHEIKKRFNRN